MCAVTTGRSVRGIGCNCNTEGPAGVASDWPLTNHPTREEPVARMNISPQPCDVQGCTRPRYQRRTLCSTHAMRKHRYGDPLWARPIRSVDLTGQRFGRLVACERADSTHWHCVCDCGAATVIRTWSLTSGGTTSCGKHRRRDDVGYSGVHRRLSVDFGPASARTCVDCGRGAAQWSYSREDADELSSPEGPYSLKPEHYAPRCVPCHKTMDLALLASR